MNISQWPESQRPREKFLHLGPTALSDAELLALLLRTGSQGQSALDLAYHLLARCGSLRKLLQIDISQLAKTKGMGSAKCVQLHGALELAARYHLAGVEQEPDLRHPQQVRLFLKARLRDQTREIFACLFLNNHFRLIQYEELFFGTINRAEVHPREIIRRALHYNCAAVIFAHNHPSGDAEPSSTDIDLNNYLQQTLRIVDVQVVDHFIVGENKVTSMSELGLCYQP